MMKAIGESLKDNWVALLIIALVSLIVFPVVYWYSYHQGPPFDLISDNYFGIIVPRVDAIVVAGTACSIAAFLVAVAIFFYQSADFNRRLGQQTSSITSVAQDAGSGVVSISLADAYAIVDAWLNGEDVIAFRHLSTYALAPMFWWSRNYTYHFISSLCKPENEGMDRALIGLPDTDLEPLARSVANHLANNADIQATHNERVMEWINAALGDLKVPPKSSVATDLYATLIEVRKKATRASWRT